MSEYTPTTDEVRSLWWHHILEGMASNEASLDADWKEERALAQFDRWLAAYTAEKQAQALKAAAFATRTHTTIGQKGERTRSERFVLSIDVREWLQNRADEIRAEGDGSR